MPKIYFQLLSLHRIWSLCPDANPDKKEVLAYIEHQIYNLEKDIAA